MKTFEIIVPENKVRLVKAFLKELDIAVRVKQGNRIPNIETKMAMTQLKEGNGIKFASVEALFNSADLKAIN